MASTTNAFSSWCMCLRCLPDCLTRPAELTHLPSQTTARSGLDPASSKLLLYSPVLKRTHEMEGHPPRPSSSTWGTSSRMIPPSSTPSSPKSTKHSSGLLLGPSIMVLPGQTTARLKTPRMSSPRKPSRRGSQRARRSVLYAVYITLVDSRRWMLLFQPIGLLHISVCSELVNRHSLTNHPVDVRSFD